MTLEVYKEIHAGDSVERLAELMTDEAYYISCDARHTGWYDAVHDIEHEEWFRKQVEHHKMRIGWLYDTIIKKMKEA